MQFQQNDSEVWARSLSDDCVAVLLFNRNTDKPQQIEADFSLV